MERWISEAGVSGTVLKAVLFLNIRFRFRAQPIKHKELFLID